MTILAIAQTPRCHGSGEDAQHRRAVVHPPPKP